MSYVAEGYNSFETKKTPSGVVKFLPDPKSVLSLIQSGKLKEHILLVQGGTTTFLAPALSMGAIGIITMSGVPESHLGILSREFQMPCVMTAYLVGSDSRYVTGGNNDAHFEAIIKALDGKKVRLHCEDRETGRVALIS
ncbi:PEP-utilizing family enzyme [Roseiarcus fermentans]|uniref:PEP-utilizing family enzyme n=1 Tax=Roseiarcus fermentans TaxID=1473586 RepID=A0A366FN53_9HYPH|nr:PEP-utilizing enzyme [Roseiarcus fermentans]RBP16062.1 PEP-utilizing family enzyme [Roseiarcus fermentans]